MRQWGMPFAGKGGKGGLQTYGVHGPPPPPPMPPPWYAMQYSPASGHSAPGYSDVQSRDGWSCSACGTSHTNQSCKKCRWCGKPRFVMQQKPASTDMKDKQWGSKKGGKSKLERVEPPQELKKFIDKRKPPPPRVEE
eukprot:11794636-Alexandrium_andersonii.AAC.1